MDPCSKPGPIQAWFPPGAQQAEQLDPKAFQAEICMQLVDAQLTPTEWQPPGEVEGLLHASCRGWSCHAAGPG